MYDDLWERTNKYAGYRYAVTSSTLPDRAAVGHGSADHLPLDELRYRAHL